MEKERPILFSTDMVRAVLDGTKTMTRRVIKPQPIGKFRSISERFAMSSHCPYGQVGDRLWVRETWTIAEPPLQNEFGNVINGSLKGYSIEYLRACELIHKATVDDVELYKWRPSIHMPRWASRITLEITEVRVERLQDITEDDAIAEGVSYNTTNEYAQMRVLSRGQATEETWPTPQESFKKLWGSLNARRGHGWGINPWVWVISFRR